MKKLLFVLFIYMCIAQSVYAATTYTINPGDDINAAVAVLQAGDTLNLNGGTYYSNVSSSAVTIRSGTSWSNPITIQSTPGQQAILMSYQPIVLTGYDIHHIQFLNLILDGSPASSTSEVVYFGPGTHHLRISGGHIQNGGGQGHQNGDSGPGNEYLNIKVHNNGRNPSSDNSANHGFYVNAPQMLIEGCEFYNHSPRPGSSGYSYGLQIYKWAQGPSHNPDSIIRNNYMHDNDVGANIGMSTDLLFYNNVVVNNRFGGVSPIGYGAPLRTKIYNNTIMYNGGIGIEIDSGSNSAEIKNNIVSNNNINIQDIGSGTTFSTNICNTSGTGCSTVGTVAFTDGYHLVAGSIAVNAGVTLASVPFDYDKVTRPRGAQYDIGAFEYPGAGGPSPTEFYVSAATGVDVGRTCAQAGMPATPTLTIGKAISCITAGGSKIHIGPGVYAENIDDTAQFIPGGTSWATATIIEATTAGTVTLTSTLAGNITIFMHNASQGRYIIFDGLVLDGLSQNGSTGLVFYPGTDHIAFQNGQIHHYDTGVYWKQSNDSVIKNTKIHDIISGHGIVMGGSNGAFIQISELYNIFGSAFEQIAGLANSALDFTRNVIHDIGTGGVYAAVVLAQGSQVLAANNLIFNCDAGIDVQSYNLPFVYNNTVYGCVTYGIRTNIGASNVYLINNIAYANATNISDAVSSTQISNFTTDPKFINAAIGNFQLQNISGAIDIGYNVPEVTVDLLGVTRPQRSLYTIGAYEFVGVPGVPDPGEPVTGVGIARYGRQWAARGFFTQ